MIHSGGVTSSNTSPTRLPSSSSSQIFGCNIPLKKTNDDDAVNQRKISRLNIVDGGKGKRSCTSSNVVCPKAVTDSGYSQTCLDPDASNVRAINIYFSVLITSLVNPSILV